MTFTYPEGATPLSPEELDDLKFKHVTTRGELDQLEQANIVEGLRWLDGQSGKDILTETFIRNLHLKLFGEVWDWAGSYRKTEKSIGIAPYDIPTQLRLLLDDVKFWIENRTYSGKEIALRLHHRIVMIHLFPNGNGRHARILADAVLTKVLNQPPINWTRGYDLQSMTLRRREYIAALQAADQGDYPPLLEFAQ